MIYAYLVVSCIVFIELLILLDLKKGAIEVVKRSHDSIAILTSPDLDDDAKEALVKSAAIEMLKIALIFSMKMLLICLVLFSLYWVVVAIFPELKEPIAESLLSPVMIVELTCAAVAYAWARNAIFK